MGRRLDWLPPRPLEDKSDLDVPFVQETPDVVRVLILQLARGTWSTLARLLQLACLTLDFKPLLAHEMANAGATGVVLDVLCQAPRHHPAWEALSTAGAGLLAALVRCEGGTEAAQPRALQMLLAMLESDLTCGPARQAVATVLHCIVAQRTVHRDKLLAVGALPVLLRVLRRLDVLCDLVAAQELLWTLVYLTDEGALSLGGGSGGGPSGADCCQPEVAERLVPLLFLYGMPWHAQHGHLAALATRALHVHVAGYDAGKDTLRDAGMLSVLVDSVRRHSAPYVAAAETAARQGRRGSGVTAVLAANGSAAVTAEKAGEQPPDGHGAGGASTGRGQVPASRGSFAVRSARPPPHEGCNVHADGDALTNGTADHGPYSCGTAAALGTWTPWQRLLAVLLISGIVPGLLPATRRRRRDAAAAAARSTASGGLARGASSRGGAGAAAAAAAAEEGDEPSTPSTLRSSSGCSIEGEDDDRGAGAAAPPGRRGALKGDAAGPTSGRGKQHDEEEEEEGEAANDDDVMFGSDASEVRAALPVRAAVAAQPPDGAGEPAAAAAAIVADGARVVCYGLLLPLLVDAGEEAHAGGAGAAAAAVGGALLRRRLCPLRESLATLKTLLCDCEANQLAAAEQGLAGLLVQLVAHGDMGLAWQAAEAAVFLSGGSTGAALVAAGAAEEMAYLLEESADLLHGLTLRKQIQVQKKSMAHGDHHTHHPHSGPPAASHSQQQQQMQHQQKQQLLSRTVSVSAASAAAAAPPAFTDVHVRPNHTASGSYGSWRPQRVYLVGRVALDFTTSSSCFYGSHDAMSYCDYCTPSAAIKVLLRLMAATAPPPPPLAAVGGRDSPFAAVAAEPPPPPPGAQEDAVCRRFAAAGGLYGVLLLLHHEAAGVHHSKLAASLLTLLDLLLVHAPGTQDELRLAGGLGVLTTLLGSLMRPGVMDVYQLRVATCRTLRLALQGNAANKLAAREHGLLPLLVSLLTVLAQQRKARTSEVVVDDTGPLTMAVLEALAAAAADSPGTQEALVALGLLHPLCDLLRDERLDVEVRTAAVRSLSVVVEKCPAGQAGALVLGVVPPAVAWLERCVQDAAAAEGLAAAAAAGGGGGGGKAPVSLNELAAPAAALAALLGVLLRGGNPQAKPAVVSAGALGVLLNLLRGHSLAAAGAAAAAAGATGGVRGLAASVLAVLIDGDTDLQNELVSQGGLTAAADVVRAGGAAAPAALKLLSCMLRANTFVKNTARQAGLPATLVAAVRRCGLVQSTDAAAAAAALTELAVGNHANQEAVAVQGGLEVAVDLLRDAFAALPLRVLAGGGGGGGAAAAVAAAVEDEGEGSGGGGDCDEPAGGKPTAAMDADSVPYTAAEAADDAAAAAALSRLLRALLGLVCACVELNGGNKAYVRELGGVSLLGELLLATAEALTAPPPHSWMPYNHQQQQQGRDEGHGAAEQLAATAAAAAAARRRDAAAASRAAVSPAVAAACGALVAVTRESSANLARLEEQSGLAVALFKLLVATDAPTSLAAALAIEWLVVRSRARLDAPSREIFELNLVDVLVLALYVPYAPLPLPAPPSAAADGAAAGAAAGASYAAWLAQQQRQHLSHGPWYAVVRALMPADGLAAAAVRDAAAVLTAVADAADALDAQRRQQQQQHQSQQHQGNGKAAVAAKASLVTTSHGSLPPLEAAPVETVALNHNTGLMVSNLLAGPLAAAEAGGGGGDGPGSQTWWAELAGSAASAFQRVANGALTGASGGAAATAPAGAGPAARSSSATPAQAPPAAAPAGLYGATSAAAQERRRQVAWMLFLLAAKSAENRARIRWLVRASLSPLAQQLANAELCRAQLEAAAAAPLGPASAPGSGSGSSGHGLAAAGEGGAGGGGMQEASSAALESASSIKGRLPISTTALEELGGAVHRAPLPPGARVTRGAAPEAPPLPPPPLPSPPPPPPPHAAAGRDVPHPHPHRQQQQPETLQAQAVPHHHSHLQEQQQQQHRQQAQHLGQQAQEQPHAAYPAGAVLSSGLPPQPRPPGRPTSASSASAVGAGEPRPTGQPRAASTGAGGAGLLYGQVYGAAPTTTAGAASSVPATPREPYPGAAVAGNTAAGVGLRFTRLSRTASGSAPALAPPPAGGGSGSAAAAAGSASSTPRVSLTGAAAAAFAPAASYPGGTGLGQGVPRAAGSPSPSRTRLYGASPAESALAVLGATALAAPAAPPAADPRVLRPQVSAGGSSVMSDDDELAMIQQEVALLANTTNALTWSAGMAGAGGGAGGAGAGGYRSAGTAGTSPAGSPARWGGGRR